MYFLRVTPLGNRVEPESSNSRHPAFEALYEDLKGLARAQFRNQGGDHTLQPTALVHEVYVRLAHASLCANDDAHLLATAAQAMRHVLIDHARAKHAKKRGGGEDRARVTLAGVGQGDQSWDVLVLHDAVQALGRLDPRQAHIVELRVFGGLTMADVARVVGVSERTAYVDWQMAKAWLESEFVQDPPDGPVEGGA